MNVKKSIAKKAFKEIKEIKSATNMMTVHYAVESAVRNAFGMKNWGLLKLSIETGNKQLTQAYGYSGKLQNVDLIKRIRTHNFETYGMEATRYLMTFIPERLKRAEMYRDLYNKCS